MSEKQGAILIQLILSKIGEHDNKTAAEKLSTLPLTVIKRDQAETLLTWFLDAAKKSNNTEIVRMIIMTFDDTRSRVDVLPAITNLFLNTHITSETLDFALSCFPEKTPLDFYVDLVNMGDDMAALKAAAKINTLFPSMSHDDWKTLVTLTDDVEEEEYENQMLRSFFMTKAAETSSKMKPPKWILFGISERSQEQLIAPQLPSVKDAVDFILNTLQTDKTKIVSDNGKEVDSKDEKLKESLIAQYSISIMSEKAQLLEGKENLQVNHANDVHIFQEFGPVNTIYTLSPHLIDPNHECGKYGGCRMLLCKEFEQIHPNGEDVDIMAVDDQSFVPDWYRKCCDNNECRRPIPYRHYSVRQPLHHGGWRGCYCSFECMEPGITDEIVLMMIARMKEQLDLIGIRDRNVA